MQGFKEKKSAEICVICGQIIREIHKYLVTSVRDNKAKPGEYCQVQNFVANSITNEVIYTPPSPVDVPTRMYELVAWINDPGDIHPVLVNGIAQFQLVHFLPFLDGNGRASRLLSTLILYRAGYDFKRLFTISEFYDRDRTEFYSALQSVREHEMDLTGWLDYFTTGLATQLDEVKLQGKLAIQADALAADHKLNTRQTDALRYLLREGELSIEAYESLFPDVSRRTLQL